MTKLINYLLILFAFTFAFQTFLINTLPLLIFVLWLIEGDLSKKWKILKNQKIFWIIIGLSFLVLLSFLWSNSIYDGYWGPKYLNGLVFWAEKYFYNIILLPVLLTHTDKKQFKYMISAFLLGMFITEVISYGIFFEIWKVGDGYSGDPSPFYHHTYYSIFLTFTIFILLSRYIKEENTLLKIFYLFFALTAIGNLFINGGRTGQVAFLISVFYFAMHHYGGSFRTFVITIFSAISIFVAAYNISPIFHDRVNLTVENFQKLREGEMQTSFGQRVALWLVVWEVAKEQPILGSGFGDAKKEVKRIQEEKYPDRSYITSLYHIHNQFVALFLYAGIFTTILLLMIFYLLFCENFDEYDEYARVFGLTLLILFMTETPYHFSSGVMYIMLFLGLLFGVKSNVKKEIKENSNENI